MEIHFKFMLLIFTTEFNTLIKKLYNKKLLLILFSLNEMSLACRKTPNFVGSYYNLSLTNHTPCFLKYG